MPEIKNTFLKSKMNKDLDSRIVPNSEYRDAKNVSVSRSEGSDVGSLENVLGNCPKIRMRSDNKIANNKPDSDPDLIASTEMIYVRQRMFLISIVLCYLSNGRYSLLDLNQVNQVS